MADSSGGTSVFISYSRKDKEFVRRLNDSLDNSGINAWVDWEGIPLSSDWMEEITRAIEAADAVLFVISQDSLDSKVCTDELELALKLNKKLVPILFKEPKRGTPMHDKVAATNWVYLREKDDYEATMPKLMEAINTDLDWVRQHTRILQRAKEWESKGFGSSYLLRGGDLEDAEQWLSQAAASKDREVLPLQTDYIVASKKGAERTQRLVMGGVLTALVVAIALAIYALQQSNIATEKSHIAATQESIAKANYIVAATAQVDAEVNAQEAKKSENSAKAKGNASEAQVLQFRAGNLYSSVLKAIRSWQRQNDPLAEEILRQNISLLPVPLPVPSGAFIGHSGSVKNIFFTPDGERFISTSDSDGREACVWTKDGEKIYCVHHSGSVSGALLIMDGKILVTASEDKTVQFINFEDGKPWDLVQSLKFDSEITSIDYEPISGRFLAIGKKNGDVELLNILSMLPHAEAGLDLNQIDVRKKFSFSIPNFKDKTQINIVKFSPNGDWLTIATKDGKVLTWWFGIEIPGPVHEGEIFALSFSPDSRNFVTASEDSTARLSRVSVAGERFSVSGDDWIEDVEFSPDGKWFVVASDDFRVYVYNTTTGKEKLRMAHTNFVLKVEISPDGQWIASTGYDRVVRVWNSATGARLLEIPVSGIGNALAFSPDGQRLVVGDQSGNITVWDISELYARIGYIEFPELAHEAIFSPDGNWLAVNTDDRKVWFFPLNEDAASHPLAPISKGPITHDLPFVGPAEAIIQAQELTYHMQFSNDSQWLFAVQPTDLNLQRAQLMLYSLEQRKQFSIVNLEKAITAAFNPQNELAILGPSTLSRWKMTSDGIDVLRPFAPPGTGEAGVITAIAFHPNGHWMAVGGRNAITIWDYESQKIVGSLSSGKGQGDFGTVSLLSFSPDGKFLAAASSEGISQIWHIDDGELIPYFGPITDRVILMMAYNPQNTLLAMAGTSGYVYLIDLNSGTEISRIPHLGRVSGVSFSQDGTMLATVSRKIVQIWQLDRIPQVQKRFLTGIACDRLRNATDIPWDVLFPDGDYQTICLNLPLGRDD